MLPCVLEVLTCQGGDGDSHGRGDCGGDGKGGSCGDKLKKISKIFFLIQKNPLGELTIVVDVVAVIMIVVVAFRCRSRRLCLLANGGDVAVWWQHHIVVMVPVSSWFLFHPVHIVFVDNN